MMEWVVAVEDHHGWLSRGLRRAARLTYTEIIKIDHGL
jgi:hypothetical protein